MGEWSEYFEDFPEENPANYVDGKFDPKAAELLRSQQARVSAEQTALNKEIADIVRKHRDAKKPG
ncbi:hypothetical protein [Ideonella sp.]|uniref:hypothetical protein n=1 Tax=Ideonella sp. TaxID=1929293 RepID=UPI0035B39DFA